MYRTNKFDVYYISSCSLCALWCNILLKGIDMIIKNWRLWILLAFPIFVLGKQISPDRVIKNVENTLISAKTVRVAFEETYLWELAGEEQSLKGELLLEGEDRFRITTEDQVIVSDGETLWTYSKPSHRVLIDRLTHSDNTILPRQILFQHTRDYRSRIVGEDEMLGKPCYVLEFTAETGDVFMTRIKVWVDKEVWVPRKIVQTDLNENRTIFLLQEIEIGVLLKKGTFQFPIPEGADVVDMR